MPATDITIVHLVRHAEVHNPQGIVYGRLPRFRLSERGFEQVARTAKLFAGERLAAIYTSPQLRARQTARVIAAYHPDVPLRVSTRLAEVLTSWQGSVGDVLGKYFNFYEPKNDPDDESIADIFARMRRIIELARRRHAGRQSVLVSHGDPIVIARTGYSDLPLQFENLRRPDYPALGSVTSLTFHGRDPLPDISHCAPACAEPASVRR